MRNSTPQRRNRNAAYLCGGINGLSDSECRDWREKAKRLLSPIECLDPMRHDYRGNELRNEIEIVMRDTLDIQSAAVVLANVSKPSWGTAMELRIAFDSDVPVVAFGCGDSPSPWLVFHCECIVATLEEAISEVRDRC
jgi:hypothetical protein